MTRSVTVMARRHTLCDNAGRSVYEQLEREYAPTVRAGYVRSNRYYFIQIFEPAAEHRPASLLRHCLPVPVADPAVGFPFRRRFR